MAILVVVLVILVLAGAAIVDHLSRRRHRRSARSGALISSVREAHREATVKQMMNGPAGTDWRKPGR